MTARRTPRRPRPIATGPDTFGTSPAKTRSRLDETTISLVTLIFFVPLAAIVASPLLWLAVRLIRWAIS